MPASDVSAWAKASTKPSYTLDEVSDGSTRKLADKIKKTINITWTNLKSLRDNSQLVPGQWYRITDYECTTTQEKTQSAGHQFDIIVRADDVNVINENAYAALHEGDTYFANSNLAAWKLRYTIDNIYWSLKPVEYITFTLYGSQRQADYIGTEVINDTEYYKWQINTAAVFYYTLTKTVGDYTYTYNYRSLSQGPAIESYVYNGEEGKGTILRMIDEFDNDCSYDFKNIQYIKIMGFTAYITQYGSSFTNVYERYKANDKTVSGTLYYGFKRVSYKSGPTPMNEYLWTTTTALTTSMSLYTISGENVSIYNSVTIEKVETSSFNTYTFNARNTDASINGGSNSVTKNSIASYVKDNKQFLNVIYFKNNSTLSAYDNSFRANCHDMSFENNCYGNTFANNCYDNSFGNNCTRNSFANNCYDNSFGNSCYNNTFGDSCSGNTFENSCYNNSFRKNCSNNSFGNYCYDNSFGNNCTRNSFANNCYDNSFGNNCTRNSFANYCAYNSFGNDCEINVFVEYCYNNSFGNDCNNISFLKNCTYYVIVENGNQFIDITSTQTTSDSNLLRNIKICQGVNNTNTAKTISHDTVNDTFQTEYKPVGSQIINV